MAEPPTGDVVELYDRALPHVYGYLARRADSVATAEDLTAEVFMAAVIAVQRTPDLELNIGWLIATARHKLIDHWRRSGRHRQALADLWDDLVVDDHADEPVHVSHAREALAMLAPQHRTVLTLRYLDDLAVNDVAVSIGKSIHATESLLTRAKSAFRTSHATLEAS